MKDYEPIARKITRVLSLSQSLSSAAFVAVFTVNALVAIELTGRSAYAGVPGALCVLGQAGGALAWGYIMEWAGRRRAIALGQVTGAAGSAIAVMAVADRSFLFFLAGLILIGVARSAVDLGRFAAAEVNVQAKRGHAVATVVLGSTAGAILGPLLTGPTGHLAAALGLSEFAGPYGLGVLVLGLAAIFIYGGLRPDPRDVAREMARAHPEHASCQEVRPLKAIVRDPDVVLAVIAMVFAQMVMMVPMSITSVHMKAHHHTLTMISWVISAHTFGMYAFSVVSGRLTDQWGRKPVIFLGSVVLALASLMAGPSVRVLPLAGALFLPRSRLEFRVCGRLHPPCRPAFAGRAGKDRRGRRPPPQYGLRPESGGKRVSSTARVDSSPWGIMAAVVALIPPSLYSGGETCSCCGSKIEGFLSWLHIIIRAGRF